MTSGQFRTFALSLPATSEESHMNHPVFRVGGRTFATLTAEEDRGMVKLTLDQKADFLAESDAFEAASGKWGAHGATMVTLKPASQSVVRRALLAAWKNTAPAKLQAAVDAEAE